MTLNSFNDHKSIEHHQSIDVMTCCHHVKLDNVKSFAHHHLLPFQLFLRHLLLLLISRLGDGLLLLSKNHFNVARTAHVR